MTSGNVEKNDKFSDNGKLPEDIPPADNDSVVEAQLRQAAIAEKDPQKKNIGLQKKMRVTDIKSLEVARIRSVTKLKINIEGQEQKDVLNIVENLKAIALVENNSQGSQIEMQYNLDSGSANIELDKDFRILLNDDNMDKLVENCGKENIDFQYRAR